MSSLCHCGAPVSVQLESLTVASVYCPIGHREYFYRNDQGKWETGAEKMKRMGVKQTCKQCGKKFVHFMDYCETKREKCDDCLDINGTQRNSDRWLVRKAAAIKDNKHSPWHRKYKLRRKDAI